MTSSPSRMGSVALLALGISLAVAASSPAQIISTHDHLGDGFASGTGADTFVSENSPGSNYGASTEIMMRNQTGALLQQPYLRFDLSALNKMDVRKAYLQIYDYRYYYASGHMDGQTFDVWALNNEALDNWTETATNWSNAPGNTPALPAYDGPDFNADATRLGSITFVRQGSTPWSVPLEVPWLAGRIGSDTNGQLTLMVVGPPGGTTLLRMASKETINTGLGTSDPILVGSAATRLIVDDSRVISSTYDHDGDGLASGNGADTYIAESGKTSNYGAVDNFKARNNPGGQQEVGYLRFDLSGVADKGLVGKAELQLYDYRWTEGNLMHNKTFSVWALGNEALDNWNEVDPGGIEWNAAPGHLDDGNAFDDPDFNGDAVYLGDFTFTSQTATNGWGIAADIPGLRDVARADTNDLLTLMIVGPQGVGSLFYIGSKETVQDRRVGAGPIDPLPMPEGVLAPRLIMTIVPEPTTMALALGGFGLLLRRSRRRARRRA